MCSMILFQISMRFEKSIGTNRNISPGQSMKKGNWNIGQMNGAPVSNTIVILRFRLISGKNPLSLRTPKLLSSMVKSIHTKPSAVDGESGTDMYGLHPGLQITGSKIYKLRA